MEKQNEISRAKALISQCVALGLLVEENGYVTVFFEPDDGREKGWHKMTVEDAAQDLVRQDAFEILELAIENLGVQIDLLIGNCLEKGILKEEDGIVKFPYCALDADNSEVTWTCREHLKQDLLYEHTWLQKDYKYNLRSREYLAEWLKAYIATEESFPILHDMLFNHSNTDLLFSAGTDEHTIYYFNPDSNCGGQIVICPFDDEMARRIINGEEWINVVAETTQYLADINHGSFFDTIEELIDGYMKGEFIDDSVDSDSLTKMLEKKNKENYDD